MANTIKVKRKTRTRKNRVVHSQTICAYKDCEKDIPSEYGQPGVALSRVDRRTLICSHCSLSEEVGLKQPSMLRGYKVRK